MSSAPLRIALLEFYGVGGTADYTDCLASALVEQGHSVLLVTSSLFEPQSSTPGYEVARVFRYTSAQSKPLKALKLGASLRAAHGALRRFAPHVVHAQGTVMPVLEKQFYASLHGPLRVCTVHDVEGHERRPWLGSYTALYRAFDALVCHSRFSRARVRDALPHMPVAVIPHARYTPLLSERPDRAAARQSLGLPPDARVALQFGFIRRYKGLDLFVEAIARGARLDPTLVGVVAGRPLYDVSAVVRDAELRTLPLHFHLRFIPRAELGTYFAAADVVALPYIDTSDSGMLELAAAFDVPVVTSSAGGLAEAFGRYGRGALVPVNDASALAEALVRDHTEPAAGGGGGSGITWDEVAERSVALYAGLLSADRRRAHHSRAA